MTVEPLGVPHVPHATALLDDLRVSLFGIASHRLHAALADDAAARAIDGRVAIHDRGRIVGIVLAAPAQYWRSALIKHWTLAAECAAARLANSVRTAAATPHHSRVESDRDGQPPARTWADPGDAWRIIIVGTAPSARGGGVGRALYRRIMADRSLVARIARDNTASIRLHESLGWKIYPDGDVLLAVHDRDRTFVDPTATTGGYSAGAVAG